MNNIKIFKTIKYALGILSICTLMSIATFSTQTKAEVSGEKVTTSVEAVTTKPSESTKTTETTKLAETTKPQETTKASNIKKSALNPVKSKVILLDPGHCKKHIGARGNGLKEEDVNLDIGKVCRNYLNKYSDVTVYMTRTNSKCVKKLKLGDCLTARNHLAKRLSADAKGIINYYKLSAKNIEGDFQTISGKTYFVDKEGNKIAGWVKKDGKWYHFNNKTAVMNKGFYKEAR
ncbi:MAG: N-acetylmuramoyl-L-alanine amidase [Eubacterium sp.]